MPADGAMANRHLDANNNTPTSTTTAPSSPSVSSPFSWLKSSSPFIARATHYYRVLSPARLFDDQTDIDLARQVLADPATSSLAARAHASDVLEGSTYATTTGEMIPWYLRLASWSVLGTVPVSGLIYVARFMPMNTIMFSSLHILNQSHVAAMTYVHSGAGAKTASPEATTQLAKSYLAATSSAVGVVFASKFAMSRSAALAACGRFAPLPAAMAANLVNLYMMRSADLRDGIRVTATAATTTAAAAAAAGGGHGGHGGQGGQGGAQQQPVVVGQSQVAAQKSLAMVGASRALLPAGNFLLVPGLLYMLERSSRGAVRMPGIAGATLAAFSLTLPLTFALFDREQTLPWEELEPHLRSRVRPDQTLHYDRGL